MKKEHFVKLMRFPNEWVEWNMYPDELFEIQLMDLADSVAEGVGVGIGEFWGAKIPIFPDAWGDDGWRCR